MKKLTKTLALLLAIASLLSGCGGAKEPVQTEPTEPAPVEVASQEDLLATQEGATKAVLTADIQLTQGVYVRNLELNGDGHTITGNISDEELEPGLFLPVVRFPGIAHVIVKEDKMDPAAAKAVIPRWCRQLKTDALGILLTNQDLNRIRPLVYVRQTDSSVWERGCGSGTAALGAYLAHEAKADVQVSVSQPGGVISVRAAYAGSVKEIEITGRVQIAAIGEAFID